MEDGDFSTQMQALRQRFKGRGVVAKGGGGLRKVQVDPNKKAYTPRQGRVV